MRIAEALRESRKKLIGILRRAKDKQAAVGNHDFWEWHTQRMRRAMLYPMQEAALLGVELGMELAGIAGRDRKQLGVDWSLVNTDVTKWARERTNEVLAQLMQTTLNGVGEEVASWIESGEPFPVLVRSLDRHYGFGPQRAQLIASTEVTRAYYEGNIKAWKSEGVIEWHEWRTAHDDRVCPICIPLGGLDGTEPARAKIGEGFVKGKIGPLTPPAHPRCRCWTVPVVDLGEEETAGAPVLDRNTQARDIREQLLELERGGAYSDEIRALQQKLGAMEERLGTLAEFSDEWLELADEVIEGQTELIELQVARRKLAARELLAVDQPAQFKYKLFGDYWDSETWLTTERALDELRGLVDQDIVGDLVVKASGQLKGRSNAEVGRGVMNITVGSREKVIAHEFGHLLEKNPTIREQAQAFLEQRTQGEQAEWLGDHYHEREITKRDRFIHPYMGKIYSDGYTEIVSMGLEFLYTQPYQFATNDPEYFDFIVKLVRGWL